MCWPSSQGARCCALGTIFVKAGGSFITFKELPFSVNYAALESLAKALRSARPGSLVLGNGGGSFAHTAVRLYEGAGAAELVARCRQATRKLNSILVDYLLERGIRASSVQTSAIVRLGEGGPEVFAGPLEDLLELGVIPVVYGECVSGPGGRHAVLSTEDVFALLAERVRPEIFVLLTDVDGVYTCDPKRCEEAELVRRLGPKDYERLASGLGTGPGADVTGGMLSKVRKALDLSSRFGVPVIIMSGFDSEGLAGLLSRGEVPGKCTVVDARL
ncbi:MAG: isopentenyl phosphate kinase [Desulfurococcaceae archaeon]